MGLVRLIHTSSKTIVKALCQTELVLYSLTIQNKDVPYH